MCCTLTALLMLYSTRTISENPFLLGALYPENNQLKSAVIAGSNLQDPLTGYDLPLLQSSGAFHYLDVRFLLLSEFTGPGHIVKFVTCGLQEKSKRGTALLWLEISVSVLLKSRLACNREVTSTGWASVL